MQDYLPEDPLARFVVEIVDGLDLNHLSAVYFGKGSKPYHPALLVTLLFYGFAQEQADYEAKVAKREAAEKQSGEKARGKKPTPPKAGPRDKDQINLTDEESRIMPTSGGGFEQAYNTQAGVDVETHLIVEQHVTQHTNGKQEINPALETIAALPEALGEVDNPLADTGYYSEANVDLCQDASIAPLIPSSREKHNRPLGERFKAAPEPPPNPGALETLQHRMQTKEGKALYAKRKSTVETVFGIIKQVAGVQAIPASRFGSRSR